MARLYPANRKSYSPYIRQRAFEMYVYEGNNDIESIAHILGVNLDTLKRWRHQDKWLDAKQEGTSASFANIRTNLMLVIHRLTQRLVESMVSLSGEEMLPDENIELRIDRLTRSLERTAPMGTFLLTKQRLDVVAEIQQTAVESLDDKTITEEEIRHAFKILKIYTSGIKAASRKGTPIAS